MTGASGHSEQVFDPRQGMNELSSLLSTPLGARTIKCQSNFTLRDVAACLKGGIISAVFSCAFFLAAARNFMMNVMHPSSGALSGLWSALEPALWACVITSFVLVLLYSLDSRRSLTIDPFGLIINTQLHEGIETRLLVPWTWLSKIGVKKAALGFGGTEFHIETKYGMVYTLRWDEVAASTVTETLIAAVRTLAPQAEIDLGQMQEERVHAQDSFTELWMRSLSNGTHRERLGSLTPDTVLRDRYRVVGLLGAGGQGTAYLAIDQSLANRDVVLKEYVLPAHVGSDIMTASQQRINREIAILSSLQHPNIVRLFDSFTEDYRGYLVLEFVDGAQLKDMVDRQGPLDDASVIDIALQVCGILQYLHIMEPPVVHQDVTPDNLIRQEDGNVKLVDFNVARKFASDGSTVVVGKHAYIPPEQFRGKANAQSDIYALGCTMHFLLTGEEPEPMTVSHPAKVRGEVSKALNKIVAKATDLALADRYESARELAEALTNLRPIGSSLPNLAKPEGSTPVKEPVDKSVQAERSTVAEKVRKHSRRRATGSGAGAPNNDDDAKGQQGPTESQSASSDEEPGSILHLGDDREENPR